jgi:hydrogen cyanide synthase HcnC
MTSNARIVVVGGGVIGCAVAYYAARRGLSVTMVDNPKQGRASSASAGGLWPLGESLGLGCGVIFHKVLLEKGAAAVAHGPEALPSCFVHFALRSNAMFPQLDAELHKLTDVDMELEKTSLLFLMYSATDVAFAQSIMDRTRDNADLFEWVEPDALARTEPAVTRRVLGALRIKGEDQVNPYRFADALRAGARALGAKIVSHTEVEGLRLHGRRVIGVETRGGFIESDIVINAAGSWAGKLAGTIGLDLPVKPVRGQIVCTETLPETLTACISTSDCYLAQKQHGEIIIGSTTEEVGYDTGITPTAIRSLCRGAVRAIPSLERVHVKRVWAGLRPGSPDELPILGPARGVDGYMNAAGHFRTGIVNAPLTGLLLSQLLMGEPTTIPIEPFLAARFERKPSMASVFPTHPEAAVHVAS